MRNAAMERWRQDETSASISLSAALMHSYRCFTEHVGGISGVITEAMERLFESCPAPPALQRPFQQSRTSSIPRPSSSPPRQAAQVGAALLTPRRRGPEESQVILSPDVSNPNPRSDPPPPPPSYYRQRQRVSDTVSRRELSSGTTFVNSPLTTPWGRPVG